MAAETGNCVKYCTLKMPTTNLRFKTIYMWKIVLASEYTRAINIDMAPKPEIITSLEL